NPDGTVEVPSVLIHNMWGVETIGK
ncbi:MAG: hypothetical protein PWP62_2844, partial [Eubacteriaceae bacterium]|nr:hypothetical protein [Eubacteriaceae bacterium]